MDPRDAWKALHLLYHRGQAGMSIEELKGVKLSCTPDALDALGQALATTSAAGSTYFARLTEAARIVVEKCVIANYKQGGTLVRVDYPQAFVIMPFAKRFSRVFTDMIEPAVTAAGLDCVRGDRVLRIDDLTANVWSAILSAGVVIADVSLPNPNVYYELGLAHALGKDTFVLKRPGVRLPADFRGLHYYRYDPKRLSEGRRMLEEELKDWAERRGACRVKEILDG